MPKSFRILLVAAVIIGLSAVSLLVASRRSGARHAGMLAADSSLPLEVKGRAHIQSGTMLTPSVVSERAKLLVKHFALEPDSWEQLRSATTRALEQEASAVRAELAQAVASAAESRDSRRMQLERRRELSARLMLIALAKHEARASEQPGGSP